MLLLLEIGGCRPPVFGKCSARGVCVCECERLCGKAFVRVRGRTALFVPARWKGGGLKENCSCSSCSSCSCSSAPARLKNKNEGGRRPASDPPATRQRPARDPPATRQQPVSNPPAIRVAKSAKFFFALRANVQFCCSHFWRLASNPPAIRVAKSANFFFALCAKSSVLSFALLDIGFCHDLLK